MTTYDETDDEIDRQERESRKLARLRRRKQRLQQDLLLKQNQQILGFRKAEDAIAAIVAYQKIITKQK